MITSIIGVLIYRREKRAILAAIDDKIQMAIDDVGDTLQAVFKPVVKASMTQIGKQGGAAMKHKAITTQMATDILSSPKVNALKMAAKMGLGIDVDAYIEENGAIQTFGAAQELAALAGVDLMAILAGGLDGANLSVGPEANGNYLLPGG